LSIHYTDDINTIPNFYLNVPSQRQETTCSVTKWGEIEEPIYDP